MRRATLMAIQSFLISFSHRVRLSQTGRGLVSIRSHTSFLISIDFVIINHIGQLIKLVSFLRLALPLDPYSSVILLLLWLKVFDFWWKNSGMAPILLLLLGGGLEWCQYFCCYWEVEKLWGVFAAGGKSFGRYFDADVFLVLLLLTGSHNLINCRILQYI